MASPYALAPASAGGVAPPAGAIGPRPRVLYVDDEPENLRVFRLLFRTSFEVTVAGGGREALEIMERQAFDVVISDQRMPQMTGVDLLEVVAARWPDTCRMILTGYSDISAVIGAINRGRVYFYLEKPWKEDEIRLVVANALEALNLRRALVERDRELAEANASLERRVRERTAELDGANRDLAASRDAALEAARAKSTFLAAMSHEIRTPLNGVLGMADLLDRTALSPEQRSLLDVVRGSGEALLAVINDILDYSKIEAGRMELESVGFSLHELLALTLQALQLRASANGIEIELDIPVGFHDLRRGDPVRLRQLVTNLVGNAVKFTERGRVAVSVRALADGGVRLEVLDTGPGIPAEVLPRLFTPFTQADPSTSRRHGGTGLGLAICRRLATLMGGRIGVESEVGRGSTFWCELPLPEAAGAGIVSVDEQTAPPDLSPLAGKRVLVVDDNPVARVLIQRLLLPWRMEAVPAGSAEEALKLAAAAPFDAVVTDALMPGMDGWELAERLAALRPGVPLIMASSAGPDFARAGARHLAAMLQKPLRPVLLQRALAQHVGGWHPPAPTHTQVAARPRRVLLVEDNPVNQKVAHALLTRRGHRVDTAGNGAEALAALSVPGADYDLVLMDVQMPEMDGLEATRRLRAQEAAGQARRRRIIAMTAGAMSEDRAACREAGMDGHIAKPFRPDDLFAEVERV